MGILDDMRGALDRALYPLRGEPEGYDIDPLELDLDPYEVGGFAPAPPPAVRLGGMRPVLLDIADFRAGGIWRAGEWSTVAFFQVPRGVIQRLPAGLSYRFYVRSRHAVAGNNAASAAARTITGLVGLAQTPRVVPALPSLHHPDVVVWGMVGGVWAQEPVNAVDFAAGSVTYTERALTTQVEVYYVFNVGEWRLRVYRPLGESDTAAVTVANGSFSAAHMVDQNNAETTHRWPRLVVMVPGQRLALEVNTTREVIHNARSLHVLSFESFSTQVDVTDPVELQQLAETALREGV